MPSLSGSLGTWLLVWMVGTKALRGVEDGVSDVGNVSMNQVEVIVGQVVKHHLARCHLVLASATTTDHATMFPSILRRLSTEGQALVIVELASLFTEDQATQDHLLQGVWGDTRTNCRVFILLVDESNNLIFRFLESSKLWLEPEAPVVVIGGPAAVRALTHHTSLRNTIHMLGLTLHDFKHVTSPAGSKDVKVFRRCLYCNDGGMGIQQLLQESSPSSPVQWGDDDTVFPERLENFMGHTFKIVTRGYFPFIAYMRKDADPSSPIYLVDCLDARILNAISPHLNFTFEIIEPWDGTWGVPLTGGNWSGIVGTLQHEEADFSLNLTPSPSRMEVITHSRIYTYDPFLIVSPKPKPLPRHSALLRPFTEDLWVMVIVFTSAAGVILWLLQTTWSWASGQPGIEFDSAFLYIWGVLWQEPLPYSSANVSDQVFVGWWLMFCLVTGSAYRSSLVAHLSVQSKELPINTFEDILSRRGWSWGSRPLRGSNFLYFNQTTDPVIQELYKNMPTYDIKEAMERVMAGRFSYIVKKTKTTTQIAPLYQDRYGNSPIHLSTTEYPIFGGNSWGMRKGAPFLGQIRRLKQRLMEAGLIDLWLKDVIEIKNRKIRANRSEEDDNVQPEVDDGQVVLGFDHLQGVFYLLLLGYAVAFLTLLREIITHRCCTHPQPFIDNVPSLGPPSPST
ncbi:glutamate receptor ionotropic, kainate 4-like [Panulirus ornatus]|uniref:glutamate receptor ionotropic, kainate 4-like n=1 Tax=Panulirus ornatus TaxID=150431 RepID=UPI003A84195A